MNIRVEDNNLIPYNDWLTGNTTIYNGTYRATNFGTVSQIVEYDDDPFGNTGVVWTHNTISPLSRNGFNTAIVDVDINYNYRYSCWVKSSGETQAYFRLYGRVNGTISGLTNITTGAFKANSDCFAQVPYNYSDDEWYLWVGYVRSYTTTGTTNLNESGLYSINGTKILGFSDWKFLSNINTTSYRLYIPYNTSGTTVQFVYPRIDKCDGTEPSINTLLQNEGMWRSGTAYIKVEDNNLLDYKNWSGLTCGDVIDTNGSYWRRYGTTNCRIIDKDPFNNDNVLWRCATTGATTYGGFNILTGNFQYIDCDPTQDYRFSCWFNRKSINNTKPGGFYFGMWATSGTTALNVQDKISTNYTNTPYFVNKYPTIVNTNQDEWYLAVGYLYKTGTPTGGTVNSAIYNLSGTKITGYTYQDFINNPLVTDISIKFAPIENASGCTVDLAYPRIDLVDGTEPSIETLLNNEGPWRTVSNIKINIGDVWKNTT